MNIKAKVEFFTKGRHESKNEDIFNYTENTFVLSDGATDKSGNLFDGKSGGEIISKLLVEESLKCNLNGKELIEYLTKKVKELYEKINPGAINDGSMRFSATLICSRIDGNKLKITQIGDSNFRINGKDLYTNDKIIDKINAEARSAYIKNTKDVSGSREYILPLLKEQYKYQNNPDSILGYGFIDGTLIPNKFIKYFEFDLNEIDTLEIISDGYFSIPQKVSIEAYEKEYQNVEEEDPDKYKKYLSTKSSDDRTIAIINFQN